MSADPWALALSGTYAAHPGTWRRDATSSQLRGVASLLKAPVPPERRAELWRASVGNALGLVEDIFDALSDAENSGAKYKEKEKRKAMIQTDLQRTFPGFGTMFSGESSPYADALIRVLTAYARFRPEVGEVGYVQGMSYLAAMVLMHGDVNGMCDEIWPIFATVTNLLEDTILLPVLRMEPATMDQLFGFWKQCFKSYLPDLAAHFDELGLQPPMYLVDWVFTCYCKVLSPDVAVWVWDRLLLSPSADLYLFKAGLGLLRTLKPECLAGDLGDCMQLLHRAHPADGESPDALLKAMEQAKVSSRQWENFTATLGQVEELEASPLPRAEQLAPPPPIVPEPQAPELFDVTFREQKPIGMNVQAGGGVSFVAPASPAAIAGIQVGDSVLQIDGTAVPSEITESELQGMMGGRPISLAFQRRMSEPEPEPEPEPERPLEERLGETATKWKGKFRMGFSTLGKQITEAAEEAAAITATAISEARAASVAAGGGVGQVFERTCPAAADVRTARLLNSEESFLTD